MRRYEAAPVGSRLSMTTSLKPIVLLLGQVFHARNEWNALSSLAELRVSFDHNPAAATCNFGTRDTLKKRALLTMAAASQGWQ